MDLRHRAAVAALALLLAGCDSTSASPSPSKPPANATSVPPSSSGAVSGGPSQGPTGHPVGSVFGEPVELPSTSMWGTALSANADGSMVIIPGRHIDAPGAQSEPRLAIRGADGTWTDTPFDVDKGIDQPSGFPKNRSGLHLNGFAFGPAGIVAIAHTEFASSSDFPAYRSGAWRSSDGTSWQRSDLASVVGNVSFTASAVGFLSSAYYVVGQTTNKASTETASLLVLRSADGMHWTKAGAIRGTWAIAGYSIAQLGDALVITGREFTCNDHWDTFGGLIQGAQLRFWTSTDEGATWAAADVDASGITSAKPMPTDAAGCPDAGSLESRAVLGRDFRTLGSDLGIVDGRLVLASSVGARVASTRDLATWVTTELPDGVPTGALVSDQRIRALGADADGLVLVSLEPPRGANGAQQISSTLQPIIWRSPDGGAWTRLDAATERVTADGIAWVLYLEPWGEALFVTFSPSPYDMSGNPGWTRVRSSVATP